MATAISCLQRLRTMAALSQILTVAQMQAAEQQLIDGGETVSSLMETAGRGAAEWVWRIAAGRAVTVLCGPGNNGGDGYVIARVLAERGLEVAVVAPLEPKTAAARAARSAWGAEPVVDAGGAVLVDCLFGSGLARPLSDALAVQLRKLAQRHLLLVAVDVPSGVDSDSGDLLNHDLPPSTCTIALGAWKFAHWMMPASAMMGTRKLVDIGVTGVKEAARLSDRPHLAAPAPDAHKYTRGMAALVAGEMPGAITLSARAALRGGAGYVKIFAQDELPNVPDDIVVHRGDPSPLLEDDRIAALLVGPGFGRNEEAKANLAWLLACDLPTVCDADALVLLDPMMLDGRESPLVVTPHAGELDQLCTNFGSVGLDRLEQVRELAEDVEGIVIAKGPDTMIAAPGRPAVLMPPASSWLSTAGTGDVLAGLVASRLATGADPLEAAQQACWLHSDAARLAGQAFGAGNLVDYISDAYAALL